MIISINNEKYVFVNNKYYKTHILLREIQNYINKRFLYRKHLKQRKNLINDWRNNFFGKESFIYNTKWGKISGCNSNCHIVDTHIGNFTAIGKNVSISPREHQYKNFTIEDIPYYQNEHYKWKGAFDKYNVKIGHDVWIGNNCVILSGVEIGNGAIIAAGSIVNKSIPPYAIVGGNPARFIKWRFTQDSIKKLQETNWYEWELNDIIQKREELSEIVGYDLENPYIHVFKRKPDIYEQENFI